MLTASYPHRPKNLTTLRLFVPSEMVSEALNAGPWVSWQEKSDHGCRYIGMMIFMMACIGSRWRHIQPAGLTTALVGIHFFQNRKILNHKNVVFTEAK